MRSYKYRLLHLYHYHLYLHLNLPTNTTPTSTPTSNLSIYTAQLFEHFSFSLPSCENEEPIKPTTQIQKCQMVSVDNILANALSTSIQH